MTDPDQKPVISDAEVVAFKKCVRRLYLDLNLSPDEETREALSAFLSARVPERKSELVLFVRPHERDYAPQGWNDCRDIVMKGRGR